MDLADFNRLSGEWLAGEGPESDIVISSRVRLARNLAGYRFLARASEDEKKEIEEVIGGVIRKAAGRQLLEVSTYCPLQQESALDRQLMVERRLISKELAQARGARAVAFDRQEVVSVMINEEDHLRVQVLRSGLHLDAAWEAIATIDRTLGNHLRYAFSPELGYLTCCPTNVGTGMRVSVMVHLPALAMIDHIDRVRAAVVRMNLAVRGLYGEGTRAHGDFFQISNQITLGRTEETLVQDVRDLIPQVIHYERSARKELLAKRRSPLEDRVWRSLGTLSSARRISSEEALDCLSSVRMGINMELIRGLPLTAINELFLYSQPAHLQKREGRPLDAAARDLARASFIRTRLEQYN